MDTWIHGNVQMSSLQKALFCSHGADGRAILLLRIDSNGLGPKVTNWKEGKKKWHFRS